MRSRSGRVCVFYLVRYQTGLEGFVHSYLNITSLVKFPTFNASLSHERLFYLQLNVIILPSEKREFEMLD